jgi:hypothetical protein
MAESKTKYEYGRTPEETAPGLIGFFNMLRGPLVDAFTPERRKVITPSTTTYTNVDGTYFPSTTPGVYGPVERGLEYMPVVQGAKSAYNFLEDLISSGKKREETAKAVGQGITTLLEDQYRSALNAAMGGGLEFYDPKQKRVVSYDPLLAVGPSAVAGAMFPVKGGGVVAGMFAGVKSPVADKDALKKAQEMSGNASRDEIWQETGWWKDEATGQWKFEVSDDAAKAVASKKFTPTGRVKKGAEITVSEVLDHPELFKAYPKIVTISGMLNQRRDEIRKATEELRQRQKRGEVSDKDFEKEYNLLQQQDRQLRIDLIKTIGQEGGGDFGAAAKDRGLRDIKFERFTKGGGGSVAYYNPYRDVLSVKKGPPAVDEDQLKNWATWLQKSKEFKSSILHELQHAIQKREGWQRGGSTALPFKKVYNPVRVRYEQAAKAYPDLLEEFTRLAQRTGQKEFAPERQEEIAQIFKIPREQLRRFVLTAPPPKYLTKYQVYSLLAGEVDARTTERRAGMTAKERKAKPPWVSRQEELDDLKEFYRDEKSGFKEEDVLLRESVLPKNYKKGGSVGNFVDKPLYEDARMVG